MAILNGKKGQQLIVWMMVGIMVFIMLVTFIPAVTEQLSTTTTSLSCDTPQNIYVAATCNVIESGIFYFIGTMIAISVAIATGRRNISGVMLSIFVFILVVVLTTPLKQFISLARDSAHLNCASGSISWGISLSCIVVDFWFFWFIASLLTAAGSYLILKRVMPDGS